MPKATSKDRQALATSPHRDLRRILADWPGTSLAARIVPGLAGRPQMQIRVESGTGLVQLDVDGPPDTREGDVTWLRRLRNEQPESLTDDQAAGLDREARLVARRYLGWFLMEEWNRVIRDTGHHLAAIDQLRRLGPTPVVADAMRWLPYAWMMRARAESARSNAEGRSDEALQILRSGIRRIKRHRASFGGGQQELAALRQAAAAVRRVVERDPKRRLDRLIQRCVASERYERAAALRDRLIRG
ncbi:MAG: UvrB/UvrC motif-containing protein [Planctomycetota bacterium]